MHAVLRTRNPQKSARDILYWHVPDMCAWFGVCGYGLGQEDAEIYFSHTDAMQAALREAQLCRAE